MKKFVKYLLASTVLVGLLAGCSKQCPACPDNSSSGESSEPIVPVEVKEEWTEEELETFDDLYIEELPFAYELEITDYAGGVLFATSAKEASDEDVEAFGELLEEDDLYEAYNFSGLEESLDIAALGFDGDAYLYTRPYQDDARYNLMNTVAIGLNEDGYLQVAMAATWAPLYLLSGGQIGDGSSFFGLLFEDDEAEVEEGEDPELFNFYEEYFAWGIESAFSLVENAPSAAHPILETPTPTIEQDVTNGALLNFAVAYPFTYGNINSNYFTPEYVVSFANFEDKTFVPFTEEDFNGLVDEVADFDNFTLLVDEEDDPTVDPEPEPIRRDGEEEEAIEARFEAEIDGYTLLVIYSLDELNFGSAGSGYGISIHFVYEDFVMQNRAEFVVSAVADALQSASVEYQPGVFLTAAFFGLEEDATEDDFYDAFDEILYTLWIYDIISDEQFFSATLEYDEEYEEYVGQIYLDSDEYRVFLQFELTQDEDEDGKYIACYILGYEYTLEDYTNGCAYDIYQYMQALISYGLLSSRNSLYGYIYGMVFLTQYSSSFAAADTIESEAFAFIDMYYGEDILYYAEEYLTEFLNMDPEEYFEDDWEALEEAATYLYLAYEKYVEDEDAGIEHGMYDLFELLLASIDYEDVYYTIETKSDQVEDMVGELEDILDSLTANEYDDADWEGFQAIIDQAEQAMLAAATSDEAQEILDEAAENLLGAIKTALLAYLDRFYEENADNWTDEELAELAYLEGQDAIEGAQTAAAAEAAWVNAYQELADLIEPAG